jgi:hypothetical protein
MGNAAQYHDVRFHQVRVKVMLAVYPPTRFGLCCDKGKASLIAGQHEPCKGGTEHAITVEQDQIGGIVHGIGLYPLQ